MNRDVPISGVEGLAHATLTQAVEAATEQFRQAEHSDLAATLEHALANHPDLLAQASRVEAKTKVALIRQLLTQLDTDHIQTILAFGLQEIGDRRGALASANHNTRLLLKKDYSYQDRGLAQPTQYYVYLRRRKPKLDRYIGALFYVPQGCTLSYFVDAAGCIVFNPPHNVFQLRDGTDPQQIQVVRLVYLEPPPPDYTFDKQQNDTPEIRLHLEYLDSQTHQVIDKQSYAFPVCMYEGGKLDRYRWEVAEIAPLVSNSDSLNNDLLTNDSLDLDNDLLSNISAISTEFEQSETADFSHSIEPPLSYSEPHAASSTRRILELPAPKALTFQAVNHADANTILKRMRLWVSWSEKAMPQSRWEVLQDGESYLLMNAHFKRRILKFSAEPPAVILEHSLPVLMKWFHDLGLAVSQGQSQKYSATQLKLAHRLFVEMSLPQKDPLVVLKKLFGVDFFKL